MNEAIILEAPDFQERTIAELRMENAILKRTLKRGVSHEPKPKPEEPPEYTPFRENGVRKATAAETIPSYDEFVRISKYWLDKKRKSDWQNYRDYALFWCGVGFGLRFSDLVRIKPNQIWDEDGNYRDRLKTVEKKTVKFQQCVITEAIRKALDLYVAATGGECKKTKYLFPSITRSGNPMSIQNGWKMFEECRKDLGLKFHFSTHSMRHTCLNVCLCADNNLIDPMVLMKLQLMANHSSMETTIAYLDQLWGLTDQARNVVSDWMLGRSPINELKYTGVKQ